MLALLSACDHHAGQSCDRTGETWSKGGVTLKCGPDGIWHK